MKELLDVCLISFMFNSPAPNASKMRPKVGIIKQSSVYGSFVPTLFNRRYKTTVN